MLVLISGGAGFLGSHLSDALLAAGHQVRVLDRLSDRVHRGKMPAYLHEGVEFVQGDVRDADIWRRALIDVDYVCHLAAHQDYLPEFSEFLDVNAVGTACLYEVLVADRFPVKKVLIASSQAVYGEGQYSRPDGTIVFPPPRSRAQLEQGRWEVHEKGIQLKADLNVEPNANPYNAYGISKLAGEALGLRLGQMNDIPTVAARYSIIQGPRQSFLNAYSGACRIFSLSCMQGVAPVVFEDGQQLRDYINIEDAVSATVRLLFGDDALGVFNVGGGVPISVLDFANIVMADWGLAGEPLAPGVFRFGDVRSVVSDISALRCLGWSPKHDVRYSVSTYRQWLLGQDVPAEILQNARAEMAARNVLNKSQSPQEQD
jgi:dTDP-L-rhamnose 4-epimerase